MERTYNIPLRKEFLKVPKYKRAKKGITAIREFLKKHMKSDNIKLGGNLNMKVWERGIKNPPHHIKVKAVKVEDVVQVELIGFDYIDKTKKEEEEKTGLAKALDKVTTKKEPKVKKSDKDEKTKTPKETKVDKIKTEKPISKVEAPKETKVDKVETEEPKVKTPQKSTKETTNSNP